MSNPPANKTVSKKPAFLAAFALTASVTKAAEAAAMDRTLHYQWLRDDPDYRVDFQEARAQAAQSLEDECIRRAHEGIRKPVVYQGQLCYPMLVDPETGEVTRSATPLMEVEYSDSMLTFLLKGFKPEKYRDRGSVELSGPNGGPIPVDSNLSKLTDEQLARLISITETLTGPGSPEGGAAPPAAE